MTAAAADGVTEVTLLGQNVNSYGRDLDAAAAPLRRPPAPRRRRRRHPPRPLHEPAPQGPPARDDRGDGERAGDLRAPPPAAAERVGPRARRHAPGLHRRAVPRPARRGPRRRRRPGRHDRHHRRASRARPTTTSSAPSRSSPRPPTTAPTRSSSAPGPAPRRPLVSTTSSPPKSPPSASSGCASSSSAAPSPGTRRGSARRGGRRRRARRASDAVGDDRAGHGRTSSCTSSRPTRSVRAPTPRSGSPAPAPHHLRGDLLATTHTGAAPDADPRRGRVSADASRIEPEPFDSPTAQALVGALDADLDERYAARRRRPRRARLRRSSTCSSESVAPPHGAFLVARLDGEPVGCGALRRLRRPADGRDQAHVRRPRSPRRGHRSRRCSPPSRRRRHGSATRGSSSRPGIRQQEAMALYESAGYDPDRQLRRLPQQLAVPLLREGAARTVRAQSSVGSLSAAMRRRRSRTRRSASVRASGSERGLGGRPRAGRCGAAAARPSACQLGADRAPRPRPAAAARGCRRSG